MTAACPSFLGATALFDYVAWQEDEGQADTYTRLGAFAHHLVDLLARNDTDELIGVFRELEQLLGERSADGDDADELDAVVRMGVIESLQNICSHDDVMVDEARFHLLCGPETAEVWNEVDQVWTDAARRPSPVPRPTEAEYLDIADPDVRLYLRIHRRKADDGTLISASDVLRLETFVADITYTSKRAYRKALVSSALFGLAIAVAVAFLLVNRGG